MNLFLQHWHGPMSELEKASMAAMERYAHEQEAQYRLVLGEPLGPGLAPQLHKLYALDAAFDDFDVVVITDMDVFPNARGAQNIFEIDGLGVMTETQYALRRSLHGHYPGIANPKADYYGGAIYRFERGVRRSLRAHLKAALRPEFNKRFQDEGAMHLMASRAELFHYELPHGERWAMSSYDAEIATAHFIHVRTKVAPEGPKVTKMENYKWLVKRGLIAP